MKYGVQYKLLIYDDMCYNIYKLLGNHSEKLAKLSLTAV